MSPRKINTPRVYRSFPSDPFVRTVSPPSSPRSPASPKDIEFGAGGRVVSDAVGYRRCYGQDAGGGSHFYQQTTFLETINQLPAARAKDEDCDQMNGGWPSSDMNVVYNEHAQPSISPNRLDAGVPRIMDRAITPPRTAFARSQSELSSALYSKRLPLSPREVAARPANLAPLLGRTWPRSVSVNGGGGGGGGGSDVYTSLLQPATVPLARLASASASRRRRALVRPQRPQRSARATYPLRPPPPASSHLAALEPAGRARPNAPAGAPPPRRPRPPLAPLRPLGTVGGGRKGFAGRRRAGAEEQQGGGVTVL